MIVTALGSSGSSPLVNRPLTSVKVLAGHQGILIDCGEGTQLGLVATKAGHSDIEVICITHCHPDHFLGLPGLISTMNSCITADGSNGEPRCLLIVAPAGSQSVLYKAINTVTHPNVYVKIFEIDTDADEQVLDFECFKLVCFPVEHSIRCLGYSIIEKHNPKLSFEKAKLNGVAQKFWSFLQLGLELRDNHCVRTIDDITEGEARLVKMSYVTDTMPFEGIIPKIAGSKLAILEGLSFSREDRSNDVAHMYFDEAAMLAAKAGVEELWLTHFSPALLKPWKGLDKVKEIFPNTMCCKIGMRRDYD